jgi:hypothetical protein
MDITPSRLRHLVLDGVVPKVARDHFEPFATNIAYIRFLRDRMRAPEPSASEFYQAKLAKLKAECEQIELDMQIKRGTRIPKEDVDRACNIVFKAIAGIIKANRNKLLTDEQINEIFDLMRSTAKRLQKTHGNGSVFVQDAV